MVKNFISAKDAKQMTETSEKLLNIAFKNIKDAASYGRCAAYFDVCDVAEKVVDNITLVLKDAGYAIESLTDDDGKLMCLLITW